MSKFLVQIVYNHDNTIIKSVARECSCADAATYANELCKHFVNCSWRITEVTKGGRSDDYQV